MRKPLIFVWLLIPFAVGAYHFGPGQEFVRADRAASEVARAHAAVATAREVASREGDAAARAHWKTAVDAFGEALQLLPNSAREEARTLRLERAKARMFDGGLFDARNDLEGLLDEIESDPEADARLANDVRDALANAQYYTTWLLRLEGSPREEWEPEIEASRQHYRMLAESSAARGDVQVATAARENLESAIKLARMDLSELQGLPLPSQ